MAKQGEKNKILLVEDDLVLSEMIEEFLLEHEFLVQVCTDGKRALDLAYENNFDLWILDVKLPSMSGFELLKALRDADKKTPAIFTTSLQTIDDVSLGYLSGCDDYLKKPFELKELLLRINTLLKRRFLHHAGDYEDLGNGLKFSLLSKNLYKNKELILLPKKEALLLKIFLENKNTLLSLDFIYENLWEYETEPSYTSLRVYVRNLRKILGKERIKNKKSQGYIYADTK